MTDKPNNNQSYSISITGRSCRILSTFKKNNYKYCMFSRLQTSPTSEQLFIIDFTHHRFSIITLHKMIPFTITTLMLSVMYICGNNTNNNNNIFIERSSHKVLTTLQRRRNLARINEQKKNVLRQSCLQLHREPVIRNSGRPFQTSQLLTRTSLKMPIKFYD